MNLRNAASKILLSSRSEDETSSETPRALDSRDELDLCVPTESLDPNLFCSGLQVALGIREVGTRAQQDAAGETGESSGAAKEIQTIRGSLECCS